MNTNISNLASNTLDYYFHDDEVINSDINILGMKVDTLHLHIYAYQQLTQSDITKYNTTVEDFIEKKKEAMDMNINNNDLRFVKTKFHNTSFNVKAQASKGFSVILENQDITMILRKITDKQTNPIIKVEFRSRYLTEYGYKKCLEQVFTIVNTTLSSYKPKISRIDLCADIQNYIFTKADYDRIKCRNRTKTGYDDADNNFHSQGNEFTSMKLGNHSFSLRIYNKTKEIQKNLYAGYNKFIWDRNELYDPNKDVWRVEFQFTREYLKTLIGKDGLLDGFEVVLNSIPDLWAHGIERFKHHALTDQQCVDMYLGYTTTKKGEKRILSKHAINKRFQRTEVSKLWKKISFFNGFKPVKISKYKNIKAPEVQYFANCLKGVFTMGTKVLKGDWDENLISEMIVQINKQEIEKKGFSILDSAKLKSVEYVNDMREQYHLNGIVYDGFDLYKMNLKNNILKTLNSIKDKDYTDRFFEECLKRGQMIHGYKIKAS